MNVLRVVFIGLAVCVLGALGFRLTVRHVPVETAASPAVAASVPTPRAPSERAAATPGANGPDPASQARVETRMRESPEFGPFFAQMRSAMPHDYARVVDAVARDEADGPGQPLDRAVWDAIRDLEQAQGVLAAKAGLAELQAYFDARLAVLTALGSDDAKGCADFLYGITDPPFAGFTAKHRDLVSALALRQLAAILDGRERHIERERPTAADFDLLQAGLVAHHLSPDEVAVLLDGKTLDPPLADDRLCAIGRTYLETLRQLPDEARQRVYGLAAELLARS